MYVTPSKPVHDATVAVPGSKSYTHRVLIAAALAAGESRIRNALRSEDTSLTMGALRQMGVAIQDIPEGLALHGLEGRPQPSAQPIYLGNSGTSMRLLISIAAAGAGDYLLTVTDPFGQRGVSIATISEPEPLQLDLSTTHAVDGGDGAIDLVIGGGTPPYSVNWSNGDTQASISNLAGGVYYATVTDAHGCISSSYVAVYDETNCMAAVPLFVETSVNSAFLEWDSVPASLDYQLRYRKQGAIDWIETDSFPQPRTYLLDLDTATVYEYQTRTFCQSGSSSWSATQTFITKEQGAGACDSWEPLTIVTNAVIAVIQWDPQPDASLYRIRYRLEGTSDPWIEEESILPLITVSNLQNEKFYEFQTATLCGYGWSDWSDETYIFEVTPEFGGGVQEESPLEQKIQTSLTEVVEDIALTLSPNPASSFVRIQKPTREKGWLLLLDQAGRPVEQQLWSTNTLQLDLSPYPTGTYTVWFLSENGQLGSTQLIKVR